MKLKLLFSVFIFSSLSLFSQTALFEWAGKMGSTGMDHGEAISVDSLGNVYVTGSILWNRRF